MGDESQQEMDNLERLEDYTVEVIDDMVNGVGIGIEGEYTTWTKLWSRVGVEDTHSVFSPTVLYPLVGNNTLVIFDTYYGEQIVLNLITGAYISGFSFNSNDYHRFYTASRLDKYFAVVSLGGTAHLLYIYKDGILIQTINLTVDCGWVYSGYIYFAAYFNKTGEYIFIAKMGGSDGWGYALYKGS